MVEKNEREGGSLALINLIRRKACLFRLRGNEGLAKTPEGKNTDLPPSRSLLNGRKITEINATTKAPRPTSRLSQLYLESSRMAVGHIRNFYFRVRERSDHHTWQGCHFCAIIAH